MEVVMAGGVAAYVLEQEQRGRLLPRSILSVGCGYGAELDVFMRCLPMTERYGIDAIEGFAARVNARFLWAQVGRKARPIWHRHRMAERSTVIPQPGRKAYKPLYAPHCTLDQACRALDVRGPVLLWLDAEGAEYDIMQSGKWLMREQVDYVLVEVPKRLDPTRPTAKRVMWLLRRFGLTHVLSFPGRRVYSQLWERT